MPPMPPKPNAWLRRWRDWDSWVLSLTLATVTPGVPEIFASLQGEGASAGRACVFMRLSRCNLACHWCDTAYSWRFTGDDRPHDDGTSYDRATNQLVLDAADIVARITTLDRLRQTRRLVITGGEPLLQAKALGPMLDMLDMPDTLAAEDGASSPPWQIEVETNGTIVPPDTLLRRVHQWNVSPKLAHSGNPRALAIQDAALARFAALGHAVFKFVIARADDLAEIHTLAEHFAIRHNRIFLMPEGRTSQDLYTRGRWLADMAAQAGFNFSDRLHIHLFGDTRGT